MREAVEKIHTRTSVTELVGLVKNGDYASLVILREKLGRTRAEVAKHISITETKLADWEEGRVTLSDGQLATWRVKLSDFLNIEIQSILSSENEDLLACFWDLLWRLC